MPVSFKFVDVALSPNMSQATTYRQITQSGFTGWLRSNQVAISS